MRSDGRVLDGWRVVRLGDVVSLFEKTRSSRQKATQPRTLH